MKKELFFEPEFLKMDGNLFKLSRKSEIKKSVSGFSDDYIRDVIASLSDDGEKMSISLIIGIPDAIKTKIGGKFCENDENYAIEIADEIKIYANAERGLIYGISTLKQLIISDSVCKLLLFDYPDKELRGYRTYLPGSDTLEDFKKAIDMMIYYKYNTIMLEVGGAMEYKRRPEINVEWKKYCDYFKSAPHSETIRIQEQIYPWNKNSIHLENGDGSYMTQDEVREVIEYCRYRGIDVIPEVPLMSHSDYILNAYPELNEREEDKYPDTYCPSNPKTYEVVFDILDEVIDVFNPKYVNIGHDELYTAGKCSRCRGKDPADLYVGDVVKINDYLKKKGIRAIMWCDKMYDIDCYPGGGKGYPEHDIPRLLDCRGKIPKDVLLLNWYWEFSQGDDEDKILAEGYEIVYGNYEPNFKDYRQRIERVRGGFTSNWGSFIPEYMQRNCQNYNLAFVAREFWSSTYNDNQYDAYYERVENELYKKYKSSLGDSVIEITHATDYSEPLLWLWDGVAVKEEWDLGSYLVKYSDGSESYLPVNYGYNILNNTFDYLKHDINEPYGKIHNYIPVIGASVPVFTEDGVFCKAAYKNEYPEKDILEIKFVPKKEAKVLVKKIEY